MSNSFTDRLNIILDGRKITPWGKSLGLSNSVLGVMTQGTAPGPDHLKIIAAAENVSLNYLLTGSGSPFVVKQTPNDLDPESEVFFLSYGGLRAIVTLSDGSHTYERSSKEIDFKKIDIYRGSGFDTSKVENARYFQFPAIAELLAGKLSKKTLLGKQKDGLLYLSRPTVEPWEASPSAYIDQKLMRSILLLIDRQNEGELSSTQKARIISAVYAHAIRRGLDANQLENDIVTPIIDAVR